MRKHLFMGLHRMMGSKIEEYYQEFYQLEQYSREQLAALQRKRLGRILEHAVREVPFYRERVSRSSTHSLSSFPILTRKDIRRDFLRLMPLEFHQRYQAGKKPSLSGWSTVSTSGSTGIPITVIHDREMRERGRAGRIYCLESAGIPFGRPLYKLWAGPDYTSKDRKTLLKYKFLDFLSNSALLDAYYTSDERMTQYLNYINSTRRRYMIAYADVAYRLALHAGNIGIRVRPLERIVTTAATLTGKMRETIEKTFQCPVKNQYGSRDCTNVSFECDSGNMHILSNNMLVEVADSLGRPVENGTSGRILITLLFNFSFPLIRYEIGDIGRLAGDGCPCDNPWPVLGQVEGRIQDMITSTEGGFVSSLCIGAVIEHYEFVRRFQLVQFPDNKYELNLELEKGIDSQVRESALHDISIRLRDLLGKRADLGVNLHSRIPGGSKGKFKFTVNRSNPALNLKSNY